MLAPKLLKLPRAVVPNGSAKDYACGSYEGHKDFSCKPYGDKGNIDESKSQTVEKENSDDTSVMTDILVGTATGALTALVIWGGKALVTAVLAT